MVRFVLIVLMFAHASVFAKTCEPSLWSRVSSRATLAARLARLRTYRIAKAIGRGTSNAPVKTGAAQLNAEGWTPLAFARTQARGNAGLQAYIEELRTRAEQRGLTVVWNEHNSHFSLRSPKEIAIAPIGLITSTPLSWTLFYLDHELRHDDTPQPQVQSRSTKFEDFKKFYLKALIEDELQVRLGDRAVRDRLIKLGLRFSNFLADPLGDGLYVAQELGMDREAMLDLVTAFYEDLVQPQLAAGFATHYGLLDVEAFKEAFKLNDAECKSEVSCIMASSEVFRGLEPEHWAGYIEYLLGETVGPRIDDAALKSRIDSIREHAARESAAAVGTNLVLPGPVTPPKAP